MYSNTWPVNLRGMEMQDRMIIIFSGYNERAVISFIRTLVKNNIRFAIIARDENDQIFKTIYKKNVVLTRESKLLDIDLLKSHIKHIKLEFKVNSILIAPSSEALNRFLLKERTILEELNVIIPLVDSKVYASVSDKKIFGDICHRNGIETPDEFDSIDTAKYPFVAKPIKYFAKDGSIHTPHLIFNNEQKLIFIRQCNSSDFYYQKYVIGKSIYLLYYFHRNGKVFKYSQENIIQQFNGGSMLAAVSSTFHNSNESNKYENLFKSLHFNGLIMVELKVSDTNSYMIEANPRFWGPSQLFIDAGLNFFEAFLHDYGFLTNEPTFQSSGKVKYFWYGGTAQCTDNSSHKLKFHCDNKEELLLNLGEWIKSDVYKRRDTINIFKEEVKWIQ